MVRSGVVVAVLFELILCTIDVSKSAGATKYFNPRSRCRSVINAIEELQHKHVVADHRFDSAAFAHAERGLLEQYNIELPQRFHSLRLIDQCAQSFRTLSQNLSFSSDDIGIELINRYSQLAWDPHTIAVNEGVLIDENAVHELFGFRVSGLTQRDGFLEITDVYAGGPAYKAGLQERMRIHSINSIDTRNFSRGQLNEVLTSSNALTLEVIENEQIRRYVIKKEKHPIAPIKSKLIKGLNPDAGDILYLKVRYFDHLRGSGALFAEKLKEAASASALILDLRDIPGGRPEEALEIASHFIDSGRSVLGFLKQNDDLEIVRLTEQNLVWDKPLVVLINSSTKSSAEILAGALQDYGALVVGAPSFGKGTRQSLYPLYDFDIRGAIYVTDAFTIRPSGQAIQNRGVIPDLLIDLDNQSSMSGSTRREAINPNALASPPDQQPLDGYVSPRLSERARTMTRKEIERLEKQANRNTNHNSLTEQQLSSAIELAEFLVLQQKQGRR